MWALEAKEAPEINKLGQKNIVPNPSFESLDAKGWAVGWTRRPGHEKNVVEVSDKYARRGKYSLHLKWSAPAEVKGTFAATSSGFNIKGGTDYQLSFHCHGDGVVATFFYGKDGKEIRGTRKYYRFFGKRFEKKDHLLHFAERGSPDVAPVHHIS